MRVSKSILLLSLSLAASAAVTNQAAALTLKTDLGSTEFTAIGRPSAIRIHGQGSGPTGELILKKESAHIDLSGRIEMALDSLNTGIGMRDRHMKEKYLQTEINKTAALVLNGAKVDSNIVSKGGEANLSGVLDLHGVQRPVAVAMKFSNAGDDILCESKFKIKLSDFQIEIPKFSGITVADEVEISTSTRVAKAALTEMK